MRHVAATVYAVTTGHGGNRFGILATAVSSLSFDPPSLLVCVNRSASLHGPLASARRSASTCSASATATSPSTSCAAGRTASTSASGTRSTACRCLATAQSSFVCRRAHCHEFGTHSIFIGELIAAQHRADAAPLT
jgi:flavin reductase (DIM6/NTAB) family NADH-FMN oxidoreductase RutF